MASTINASTSPAAIIQTADGTGILNLQAAGVTQATISSSGFSVGGAVLSPYTMKNRIINGAMVIDQRNAGASVTPSSGSSYTLDRWKVYASQASKFSVQQNAASVTPPVGFVNYAGITSLSAYSVGSTDEFDFYQVIEGFNTADLQWGTANAKTVTLSFWVRSSLTGTFGGVIYNSGNTRNYPFSYSISSANTWTQISITIAGDTSGTWLTTNGVGIAVLFSLGAGSSMVGTAGAWTASAVSGATGQTSVVGTNGATFYITGVQLEVGSSATSFEFKLYNQELANCQRYYFQIVGASGNGFPAVGSGHMYGASLPRICVNYPVQMREIPTIGYSGTLRLNCGGSTENVTGISAAYSGLNTTMLQVSVAGTYTVGYGCIVHCLNATTNLLYGSAEL